MSGSGRKHVSKWDYSKEDTHHQPSIDENSGSHYRDKDPSHHVLFNADSKASRRSEEDHQHSRQDRARSRVSQNNDNSYYPKQDETWQQFSHRLVFDLLQQVDILIYLFFTSYFFFILQE